MLKILIVDDSRSARYFLKNSIPDFGFEIIEAGNGEEGVEIYALQRPDLVFMDLTMPVMDGFSAIPKILEINPDAKIIVMTADIQKQTVSRITAFGVTNFLKKPPRKEQVAEALTKVFPELSVSDGVDR